MAHSNDNAGHEVNEVNEDARRAQDARQEGHEVNESKEEARRAYEARHEGHEGRLEMD